MEFLLTSEALSALLTLTFLEIVLGIDNIIFISICVNKLPIKKQQKATQVGLALALIFRIVLLFGISYLVAMQTPWISIDTSWLKTDVSGQAMILLLGGLFLLYKSTKEISEKIEHQGEHKTSIKNKSRNSIKHVILQITIINIVFSFDSILTAVGMTNGIPSALYVMVISVILSMIIMMIFANPVGHFVNKHPSVQILGLSFLILIGFMLITEGAHLAHTQIWGSSVGAIPKGYLYFAILFSVMVEFLNMRLRTKVSK